MIEKMELSPNLNSLFGDRSSVKEAYASPKATTSDIIRDRLKQDNVRFFAGDNISDYVTENDRKALIEEATAKFESLLDTMLIDRENDPNSQDTGRRLAKMYINELFDGRFSKAPACTAFPNVESDTRFTGVLVSHAEIKSMCSHHWQPVTGKVFIGLLPATKMLGLSKYARLAQWVARRGTLQEELTNQIADEIEKRTGTKDIAVQVVASHGCCENRGIMAHNSGTYTAVMRGQFFNSAVRDEFMHAVNQINSFKCN